MQEGLFATMTSECAYLFNERELALLLAGSPDVDVEDWKAHATYTGYGESDPQIEWLWKLISELGPEERSLLLRFATGSSRTPPSGFRGMTPRFNVTAVEYDEKAALPRAATCFSMLKLPRYPTEALLRKNVMIAIRHGTEGFSFL
jgi:E3 ubiquitin-protein ligase HUWE1